VAFEKGVAGDEHGKGVGVAQRTHKDHRGGVVGLVQAWSGAVFEGPGGWEG